ncbi:type II toxin-antitoxin system PemK/MazF family toxin [Aliarcobacter cryaerophilus]|uniref:type II toxin-antitoxin system PemK/MazF family toxin n=1 Tax=Aliarcobacter cryaerophilus TaxID=28198 RepID=UPI00112F3D22|nr:type II toxin-antitoxin system PemK/MazF family toxin [Aliarcobacter cryaerophilus]QNK85945.1 type II toxin-antitoxin system PemK/MazF family toxin [Aliarcobacter cryaerophilus]
MDMKQRETRKKENPIPKGTMQIEKEAKEFIEKRLNDWNKEKKEIVHKKETVNKTEVGKVKFKIMPWTIWWFAVGENIGRELGSHVNGANDEFSFYRPCIVISKLKSLEDTDHNIITILPMSTKSDGIGIHKKFIHKLESSKYPKKDKFNKGLKNDSYVVCHQMKTIDTKRLTAQITTRILNEDINEIKIKMNKYLDLI